MALRDLSLFVIMNGGGVGADRLLRSACRLRPAAPRSVALDRGLFEGSPDLLTDGHALSGPTPTFPETKKYQGEPGIFLSMVEMVRHHPLSRKKGNGLTWQNRCYICHSLNFHNTSNSKNWNW